MSLLVEFTGATVTQSVKLSLCLSNEAQGHGDVGGVDV
jgi:hypothetical protein